MHYRESKLKTYSKDHVSFLKLTARLVFNNVSFVGNGFSIPYKLIQFKSESKMEVTVFDEEGNQTEHIFPMPYNADDLYRKVEHLIF